MDGSDLFFAFGFGGVASCEEGCAVGLAFGISGDAEFFAAGTLASEEGVDFVVFFEVLLRDMMLVVAFWRGRGGELTSEGRMRR